MLYFIYVINELHAFFLGFWTMMAILLAGLYIAVCCGNDFINAINIFADKVNTYIDNCYGATAEKLPNDHSFGIEL